MHSLPGSLIIVGLFLSCSCGKEAPPPPAPADGGTVAAAGGPVSPQPAAPVPANVGVPPAMFPKEKLEAQMPASIGDWTRIEMDTVFQMTGDGEVQQTNGVYQIGSKLPLVFISLLDTRGFKAIHGTFREMHDHPTYGITPFEQQGQPSLEQFWPRPLNTVLMTLIDERYLILINGEGSDQPTVRKFLDALDIKAIAALK